MILTVWTELGDVISIILLFDRPHCILFQHCGQSLAEPDSLTFFFFFAKFSSFSTKDSAGMMLECLSTVELLLSSFSTMDRVGVLFNRHIVQEIMFSDIYLHKWRQK